MNTKMKNAVIGLFMLGTAGGAVATIGYGINKEHKNKTEIVVTDPQKADEAIEKDGTYHETLFKVKQALENLFTAKEEVTIDSLFDQVADYTKMMNQAFIKLDSIKMANNPDKELANEIVQKLNQKAGVVKMHFKEFDIEQYEKFTEVVKAIKELQKEFNEQELFAKQKTTRDLTYINSRANNKNILNELNHRVYEYCKMNLQGLEQLDSISKTKNPNVELAKEIVQNLDKQAADVNDYIDKFYNDSPELSLFDLDKFNKSVTDNKKARNQYLNFIINKANL